MDARRKLRVVTVALGGLTVLASVVTVLAYAGEAASFLPTPPQFAGVFSPFVVIVAVALGSYLVVRRLRSRYWMAAGRGADLAPEGGGRFGATEFAGTVHGRPVRVHVEAVGGGRDSRAYTVVSAELSEEADDGVIVSPVADGGPDVAPFEVAEQADVADDRLAAVGGSEAATSAVVGGRAREALLAVEDLEQVFVGDESVAFEGLEREGVIGGENLDVRRAIVKKYDPEYDYWGEGTGDASTVTHLSRDAVLDPDELRRQVEAVVAVADAFEGAG